MTIVTKSISEKKVDKLEVPLVENEQTPESVQKGDAEAPAPVDAARFIVLRARARRVSTTTTLCLLITALMVVSIGIVGGTYLYRQYVRAQMHRFRGWCSIPYPDSKASINIRPKIEQAMFSDSNFFRYIKHEEEKMNDVAELFQEELELDLDTDSYEKIDVPNFRDGRRGRFIHDFNTNVTGIIDLDGRRCFVMPLNRSRVLPPRSLFDLIHKIWDGYYKLDTEVVRDTMRVVLPPISDSKSVSPYIERECRSFRIYKLEKYESGVFKRSTDPVEGIKFAQFSGKSITEFDIVNVPDAIEYEKSTA